MITSRDVANLQALVNQRGMSREQAQQQFGLDDGTMNWLASAGVQFSQQPQYQGRNVNYGTGPAATTVGPSGYSRNDLIGMAANPAAAANTPFARFATGGGDAGPVVFGLHQATLANRAINNGVSADDMQGMRMREIRSAATGLGSIRGSHGAAIPATGLMGAQIAAQGQGGDTQLAHVTPGETVVPREIMARPDVSATVNGALLQAGTDPNKYKVGVNPVYNPKTGIQQFASDYNVQDWYRNVAGRDATQGEIDYWNQQANTLGGQQAFDSFVNGLKTNGEVVKTTDYGAANAAYQPPTGANDTNGGSYVDEWAQNVFGRAATPEEIAKYGTATSPEQSAQLYNDFVTAGKSTGGTFKDMGLYQASQLPGASGTTGGTTGGGTGTITSTGGAPTPNYTPPPAGQGLYDAMQVPTAAQAEVPSVGPVAKATGGGNVTAGQGTAGSYEATTAAAAPDVVAGTGTSVNATATDAQAAQRSAYGYDPATGTAAQWTVDPSQTVQGQIAGITSSGSPLMTLAETRAKQEMNKRGLANSSMAVGAGQKALYEAALPIAQQDASTYAAAGQYNTGNRQQMELANMDAKNTASRFYAQAQNDSSAQNAQLQTTVNLSNASEANKVSMFNASSANDMIKTNLANALQAGIVNQDQSNKMAALAAENINRAKEFNITTDAQMQQFNIDEALKASIINSQQAQQLSEFNAQQQNAMQTTQAQLAADVGKFNASQSNALTQLGMDGQTKVALANIEASYKTLMQTSSSASSVYSQAMNNLTQILTNKDMTETAKQSAIGDLIGSLNGSLNVIGGIANLDLPQLTFGGDTTPANTDTGGGTGGGTTTGAGTQ